MTKNEDSGCCMVNMEEVSCGGHVIDRTLFLSRTIFSGKITLPVCEKHFKHHRYIVFLNNNGYDRDKLLSQTHIWLEQEAQKLIDSGILMTEMDQ